MKYKSCGFVKYGIYFNYDYDIRLCCQISHIGGGLIYLLKDFNPKKIEIDKILQTRKQIQQNFLNGHIPPNCEGCMDLKECDIPQNETKIKILMLQHWTKCNSNCIYCYTANNKKEYNTRRSYEIYPILKKMNSLNILDKNGLVNFSGGEVSCLPEFGKVVKFLDKLNYFMVINSSGIKYEKIVGDRLRKGNSCIIISVDSGTKETYEKIKRVKKFDDVWKNIKKYSNDVKHKHLLNIKYILLPGINDNEKEIDSWLNLCVNANVKNVVLGIDANFFEPNRDNIPEHILNLFYETKEKAEKLGLTFYIANRATTMLTKGKYANKMWKKYRYDDGPYSDYYFNEKRI